MAMRTLEDLFIDELKDVYDAERRITKALPKMAKAADSEELRTALERHLRQTEEHIARLETIFASMDKTPGRKTCQGMVGLLEEGSKMLEEEAPPAVMDAAIISAAQRVEHYEMAAYGCLRDWAKLLGNEDASKTLQLTLNEEGDADKKLTQIAQSLNVEAAEEGDELGDEEGEPVMVRKSSNGHRAKSTSRSR